MRKVYDIYRVDSNCRLVEGVTMELTRKNSIRAYEEYLTAEYIHNELLKACEEHDYLRYDCAESQEYAQECFDRFAE